MRSLDSSVEAEYLDGFVLSETEQHDISLYEDGRNTFYDILEGRPANEHGPLQRFSVSWKDKRYDVDWRFLSDDARPIRFRHGNRQVDGVGGEVFWWSGVDFGYQHTGENGASVQEVRELR